MAASEMQLIETPQATLACDLAGDGAPLLLVHAYPLDRTLWRKQVEHFAARYRVIAPDLAGFGESGVPATADAREMSQYADDLAALLSELGITEPVRYVGVSMAGYIGWQFAQRHRDRLAALFLACTKAAADTEEFAAKREHAASKVLGEGASALRGTPRTLLGETTREQRPEVEAQLRRIIERTAPRGIAAAQRGMAKRPDVRGWLPSLDVPCGFVAGAEDSFSPPDEMREWVGDVPNASFDVIAESGHLPMLEQPAAFNTRLEAFLQRVDR